MRVLLVLTVLVSLLVIGFVLANGSAAPTINPRTLTRSPVIAIADLSSDLTNDAIAVATPDLRQPMSYPPTWTWGVDTIDTHAVYGAWANWSRTQGFGSWPVDQLLAFRRGLSRPQQVALLGVIADSGDWRVLSRMVAIGDLPAISDLPTIEDTLGALRRCAVTAPECTFLVTLQTLSPPTLSTLMGSFGRLRDDLPDSIDVAGMRALVANGNSN